MRDAFVESHTCVQNAHGWGTWRFASPPLLKQLVMAGWYGRKSGRGFYDYANPEKPVANKL